MQALIRYALKLLVAAGLTWLMSEFTSLEIEFEHLIAYMALYGVCQLESNKS